MADNFWKRGNLFDDRRFAVEGLEDKWNPPYGFVKETVPVAAYFTKPLTVIRSKDDINRAVCFFFKVFKQGLEKMIAVQNTVIIVVTRIPAASRRCSSELFKFVRGIFFDRGRDCRAGAAR